MSSSVEAKKNFKLYLFICLFISTPMVLGAEFLHNLGVPSEVRLA